MPAIASSEERDAGATTRGTGPDADSPFDQWLRRQLHDLYGEIAKEPLPTAWIELIDLDRQRRRPKL